MHDAQTVCARVQQPLAALADGTYVRVYGNFRGEQLDNPGALGVINVFSARAVTDHNEVRPVVLLTPPSDCLS
jgi:hypothetical protein